MLFDQNLLAFDDIDAPLQASQSLTCDVVHLSWKVADIGDVVNACRCADELNLVDVTVGSCDGDAEGLLACSQFL